MNKQTFQYAVLTALTGCIMVGSMNHAMAEKPSFKCSFKEDNQHSLKRGDEVLKRYPKIHGSVNLRGLGAQLTRLWQAERMIDICNRVKAGEQIEISCAAFYDQIDYDEIDSRIPDNVRKNWNDYFDFEESLEAPIKAYKKAEEHCRKTGVTR